VCSAWQGVWPIPFQKHREGADVQRREGILRVSNIHSERVVGKWLDDHAKKGIGQVLRCSQFPKL
jgi:hypothetical protein